MPLVPGRSNAVVRQNALELMAAGHPRNQSWAAAYRKAGRAAGGLVPHLADGGGDTFADDSARLHALIARDPNYDYVTLLPIAADRSGGVHWAVPGAVHDFADSMLGTIEGPTRAYLGLPQYASLPEQALNLSGTGALSSIGRSAARAAVRAAPDAAEAAAAPLESRLVPGYNPPVKPPRPFEADYPSGASVDDAGRLTADMEGRPLGARYIAGRRVGADLGGADEALSPADISALGAEAGGAHPETVAPSEIRGAAGELRRSIDPQTGSPLWAIKVARNLSQPRSERTIAHEAGHLFDELAGQIPTDDIKTELKQVYNTLNTGRERTSKLTGPQHFGYNSDSVDRELMAEAIRGYMADPNYLKTVAPKTAARIRNYVNSNPRLAPFIQFNSIGVPTGLGALWSDKEKRPMPQDANGGLVPQTALGLVPHMASGGFPSLRLGPSDTSAAGMNLRGNMRQMGSFYHPGGFIDSSVAGRTDALPLAVPADSHVIPADVVSGIGEGNSLHGAQMLDQMFHSGRLGMKAIHMGNAGRGLPHAPKPFHFARGGADRTTDIMAAGGEYVVRPEAVAELGRRMIAHDPQYKSRRDAMKAGHDAIDDFILRARKHIVETTRRLPGPVKG
jgi:hypothetical protein